MDSFYQMLAGLSRDGEYRAVTALDGEAAGDKMLVRCSTREVVWPAADDADREDAPEGTAAASADAAGWGSAGKLSRPAEGQTDAGKLSRPAEGQTDAGRLSRPAEGQTGAGKLSRPAEEQAGAGKMSRSAEEQAGAGKLSKPSDEQAGVTALEAALAAEKSGIVTADNHRYYVEKIGRSKKLVICGAGHVSMPVITLGKMIGMHVTVIDDRPVFISNARKQRADRVVCDAFESALAALDSDEDTYFVIVTRGHRWDRECLRAIAAKPHAYIGMMGSRRRVKMVLENLREEGVDGGVLDSVHTPIGLAIGAETPEEIAISIMGEIIEVKNRERGAAAFPEDMLAAVLDRENENMRVLATIIARRGSAPRDVGTKMLVLPDGRAVGTIGGGCAEAEILKRAQRMLRTEGENFILMSVDMTMEAAEDEGMVCGGTIEVMLERV